MKKHLFSCLAFCFLIIFLIHSKLRAQEPVAPNGKFATIKGVKIYYEETGKGMPLLLLHGFGRTASDWRRFTPEFSKYYKVISVDLPGHGRTDLMDTSEIYLHRRAAEYLIGLLDALRIDSVDIIGVSSGAIIATHMAVIRPQLPKKIILIAGQVYFSNTTRNFIAALGGPDKIPVFPLDSMIKTHGKMKGPLIATQLWNSRKIYGDPSFTPDVLSTVKAGTLIIHGDNDPIAPVANAWEMFQYIPQAHLWVVPNGRHTNVLDRTNQDDFIRLVLEFLRGDWDRR